MKTQKTDRLQAAYIFLALAAVAGSLAVFVQVFGKPLLGPHAFRQTQNALSSYYFAKEHLPIWVNKMPVLGPPWNVPTELPIYQYLSAAWHGASSLPLDLSGRMVSVFFMLLMLIPLAMIARILAGDRSSAWIVVAITAASPLYLFWAPSYMMETTALFLSLTMVSALLALITSILRVGADSRRKWHIALLLLATFSGIAAAMQKGTTWASAAGVTVLLLVYFSIKLKSGRRRFLTAAVAIGIVLGTSLVCAKTWLRYGDGVKQANPIAKEMVVVGSAHHNKWNYGSWEQKLSPQTWEIIWLHVRDQVAVPSVGFTWAFLFVIIAAGVLCNRSSAWVTGILLAGFLSGPLIFTNLYMEHSYYWCANTIWLLLAVALALDSIGKASFKGLSLAPVSLVLCVVIVASGFLVWHSRFLPIWRQIPSYADLRNAWIEPVQHLIPENRSLFILWPNWNPMMHYYAERRGLAFPLSDGLKIPGPQFEASVKIMDREEPVGGVLVGNEFVTAENEEFIVWLLSRLNASRSGHQTPFGVLFPAMDLAPSSQTPTAP